MELLQACVVVALYVIKKFPETFLELFRPENFLQKIDISSNSGNFLKSRNTELFLGTVDTRVGILAFSKPNSRNLAFSDFVWPRKFNLA